MDLNDLLHKFNIPPSKWSKNEIYKWLDILNMIEYANVFGKFSFFKNFLISYELDENKVDGLVIFDIEDEEIEKCLGITNKLHRKRLRNGIDTVLLLN